MIITTYSNIDLIQGVIAYGNVAEGITDWRITNTPTGILNILNSSSIIKPEGGTYEIGEVTNSSDRYMIFKEGTSTFTVPSGGIVCDILIVGGGGGGSAGGGGAGGYFYLTNISLSSGTSYIATVGNGGTGATLSTNGNQGANSSFIGGSLSYTAFGGGGGGGNTNLAPVHTAGQVGSYGGNGHDQITTQTNTSTQGNRGGRAIVGASGSGGGGGGGGAIGGDAVYVSGLFTDAGRTAQYNKGGQGGNGIANTITGTTIFYAGGGTAGANTNFDADTSTQTVPLGGGGIGARANNANGGNGTDGLGGGGGGGDWERTAGTRGGSGIVIIRYSTTNLSIIDNGNIGIGTTPISTSSKLEIFGDVNTSGIYRKNNRDVISDTSNYVLTTSNLFVPRIIAEVGHGSNYVSRIATQLNTRIDYTSNYIASAALSGGGGGGGGTGVSSQWTNVSPGIHYTPTPSLAITSSPSATTVGGTGDYTYMVFTYTTETAGAGTGQTLYNITVPTGGIVCDILMVGGGGAGGTFIGGGGGGGGVLYIQNASISSGTYNIFVGNGGNRLSGSYVPTIANNNGKSSKAFGIEVFGGGFGGSGMWAYPPDYIANNGANGGSGGAGGSYNSGRATTVGGNKIEPSYTNNVLINGTYTYYGGSGGDGKVIGFQGGGSGGGGAGGIKPTSTLSSYDGADGTAINITGVNYFWGGGGGGCIQDNLKAGNGGKGGGGGGSGGNYGGDSVGIGGIGGITLGQDGDLNGDGIPTAGDGGPGTGGGGGATASVETTPLPVSGAGGSGIVILRFLSSTRNVGIGTTNPTSELHVYDDTTTNTKLTVQNNYIDPIVITPNTIGYTVTETLESSKYYRTLTFNYSPNYPQDPPNTSLLAWYRFDGDGLDYNLSTTKYNLVAGTGTAPTYPSEFFQGRKFLSTSSGTIKNSVLALKQRALSVSVWIRNKTLAGNQFFLSQCQSTSTNLALQFGHNGNGGYMLSVWNADLTAGMGTGGKTTYPEDLNVWVHLVYVIETNYNKKIYRNGVLIAFDTNTNAFSGTADLIVGATISTIYVNADLSDLRIYNNGLTANEVATLYASYNTLVITDNYSLNFKSPTTLLVNGVSKTVNGAYTLSMGNTNASMLPAGGQSDTPLASTAITTLPIKYEYNNATLSLPSLITVTGATSSFIGTTERAISFTYTSDTLGLTGQTQYSFTPTEDLWCDILVVGGGGGGGRFGGGGGGGGVLFSANLKINAGSSVIVKVGDGGAGAAVFDNGINGANGYNSTIIINSIEYIAVGGGGGGTKTTGYGLAGNAGGSGGGGSHANAIPRGTGGISNKNNYVNFQSFGNSGGIGRLGITGSEPTYSSGGGGGAGSKGSDFTNTTGGGNGGQGKDFISYFGTNVGHNGYFAGGGGGNTYINAGNRGYGNGGLGLYGGGGNGGFDGTLEYSADNGLINTGGGGGGGKYDGTTSGSESGGKGGSGYVIIRYRKNIAQSSSLELITSSSINISEPVTTLDRISKNTGMTGWVQVKHLPSGAETGNRTWFSGNTFSGSTVNSYTVGSPSNNAAEWSIPFDSASAQFYLFYENTNDFNGEWNDRWIVMRKSDMVEVNYPNWKPFYKASSYPNGKTEGLQYNRVSGQEQDPNIGLGHEHTRVDGVVTTSSPYKYWNAVYIENSATGWSGAPPAEVNVYVKYTADIPITNIPRELTNYNYKYMSFTHSGGSELQTSYTVNFPENTVCDILVVGGGGGGGASVGGGGGAGGVAYYKNILLNGTYTVKVGNGGKSTTTMGANSNTDCVSNGNPSSLSINNIIIYEAKGGGGGGSRIGDPPNTIDGWTHVDGGFNGGSGGGGSLLGNGTITVAGSSTQGTTYYNGTSYVSGGNNGSVGINSWKAGGGGGAGGAGSGINGGSGVLNDITGAPLFYAAGGGAGVLGTDPAGIGGNSIGGNGSRANGATAPTIASVLNGTNGTGSGGGGGGYDYSYLQGNSLHNSDGGGRGGSGIVIIRYKSTKIVNQGYNIGNYNGDFKIISTTSSPSSSVSTNIDYMRITRDGASIYNPTGSPSWSTVSDIRIKENIEKASYDKCYESIDKLELYKFSYIKELHNINKDFQQLGYIAQEVQDIFPKAVSTQEFHNEDLNISDLLSIDITQINYSLYGTVKKLIEMYNDIENRISILENKKNTSMTSNVILDTSNVIVETSNVILDTSNVTLETSNVTLETSNVILDTSNVTLETSNVILDTSNVTLETSNVILDTSNVILDTSNVILDTSNVILDTSNVILDTSNVILDTSNVILDTSNVTLETSNVILDTSMTSNL